MTPAGIQSPPLPWVPTVLAALTCLWIVGTATLLIVSASIGLSEWPQPATADHERTSNWYLLGAVVCAVLVPIVAALIAYFSRQVGSAVGFAIIGVILLVLTLPVIRHVQHELDRDPAPTVTLVVG